MFRRPNSSCCWSIDVLRKLAAQKLAQEKPGQTLEATALVHEADLRLVGNQYPGWNGRDHFLATAAAAMHRILMERARQRPRWQRSTTRSRRGLPEWIVLQAPPERTCGRCGWGLACDKAVRAEHQLLHTPGPAPPGTLGGAGALRSAQQTRFLTRISPTPRHISSITLLPQRAARFTIGFSAR
jgi:hypothetical protein